MSRVPHIAFSIKTVDETYNNFGGMLHMLAHKLVYGIKRRNGSSVCYVGILVIDEPSKFLETWLHGKFSTTFNITH